MDNNSIEKAFKIGILTLASATIATVATLWYRRQYFKPKAATPVTPFDLERYQGKWYIVARINHSQERNLANATTEILCEEGQKTVMVNRGYNFMKNKWVENKGVLQNTEDLDAGTLEVNYFGPFSKFFNIVALEGDYEYALVVGRDSRYCWILSRTPELPEEIRAQFVLEAKHIGVKVNELFWVDHYVEAHEQAEEK